MKTLLTTLLCIIATPFLMVIIAACILLGVGEVTLLTIRDKVREWR